MLVRGSNLATPSTGDIVLIPLEHNHNKYACIYFLLFQAEGLFFEPKYPTNRFYSLILILFLPRSLLLCRWDQFTVFHLVSKDFTGTDLHDPALLTGILLWPCLITVFQLYQQLTSQFTKRQLYLNRTKFSQCPQVCSSCLI